MLTELFTSKTRIRVLLKLFLNPEVSSYLRELSSEFNVSSSAIKAELDNLSESGYLTRAKKGRSIFFQANSSHPFFPEIHSIVKKSLGIDQVITQVKKELGTIQAVYILDDYAQGKDSGIIDLLIVGKVSKKKLQDYIAITENKIKRKLRVLIESSTNFEYSQSMYLKRPHWRIV